MARDYRAEYARRVRNALARGFTRSQARGHPRRGEPHAVDVTRARSRGLKRAPRPRPRPTPPPSGAARRLREGRATDEDRRALQRWRQSPYGRTVDALGGEVGLTLDTAVVIGGLGIMPSSVERIEITAHPTDPNLWRARFFYRQGRSFRDADLPRDPAVIGDLRLAFAGPGADVEIFVDTDATTVPRSPGGGPPLDDEDAEAAWEASFVG